MDRKEYMAADRFTGGKYDEEKAREIHAAYFTQYVNQWHIDCVLAAIGRESLLSSNDYHLNDIPLSLWDSLPMTQHIVSMARKYGDTATLGTKVCVYKQAARNWLDSNARGRL